MKTAHRKRRAGQLNATRAKELAAKVIDNLADGAASADDRPRAAKAGCKMDNWRRAEEFREAQKRLLKGPEEFREARVDRPKARK